MSEIEKIYNQADEVEDSFIFEEERKIDIENLHTEEQNNGELCFKYNKKKAKLEYIVEQIEELKKQVRSRLIGDCVKDPSLCDPTTQKYSDKKAESYYRLHEEYKQVIDELIKAQFELECTTGMLNVFEGRKWALKDLVSLAMSNYFESKETSKTRKVFKITEEKPITKIDIKIEQPDIKKIKSEEKPPEEPKDIKEHIEAATATGRRKRRKA